MALLIGLCAAVPLLAGAALFVWIDGPHLGSATGWVLTGSVLAYIAALNWYVDRRG